MNAVKDTGPDHYLLQGFSGSPVSGDKTEDSRGGVDFWVVNITNQDPCLADGERIVNIESIASPVKSINNGFVAYPIPAYDILHVQSSVPTLVRLPDQSTSKLSAGLYFLKKYVTGNYKK